MHFIDYLIVLAYLAFAIALGLVFGRHQSRSEFFSASHTMGWLTVGLSVMATLFSSNSFVMYPSAAYGDSLRLGLTLVSHSLITPLIVWVFIPVFTRLHCETAYEYLERRFHVSVRCLASGLFIFLRIGWMASATFAAALVMAHVSGIDQTVVILALGTVAIIYTMLGGLRAVMWTDVIQFGVFGTSILVALALLVNASRGGAVGAWDIYTHGRENLVFDFSLSLTLKFGSWAILCGIFLEALSAFGADQVAVQRYLAARSERTSQIGFLVNLLGIWLVVPALLLIGVGLFAYYDERPDELVPVLATHLVGNEAAVGGQYTHLPVERTEQEIRDYYYRHPERVGEDIRAFNLQDQAMPHFVKHRFPPGMTGLFLAALMAAIMSSIDSGVHSVTTAIVVDFRDRLFPQWKPTQDADDVLVIRGLIIGIGALAIGLACIVGPLGDVFDIGKKLTAAFGGPLLAVFILALFSRRTTTAGVFCGALLGATVTLGVMYQNHDWFSVWFWPFGFGLTILIAVLLSCLTPTPHAPAERQALTFRAIMRQPVATARPDAGKGRSETGAPENARPRGRPE